MIQRNAILSWKQLAPDVDVILMGDDPGVAEFAAEHQLIHVPNLRRSAQGTPLLSDAFSQVQQVTDAPVLVYCNCDVMLLRDLMLAVELIRTDRRFETFLAFGRREDLRLDCSIDLSNPQDVESLFQQRKQASRWSPIVCKEYFIYSRNLFQTIPDFCVGRGNWDNWMVAHARSQGIPVINVSQLVSAVHQSHDYHHLQTSRLGCYVTCPEARENQRLAGGRHVARGCVATWNLTFRGIVPNRGAWLNKDFWLDLPNFLRMVFRLPFER
ncbi:MAG TPA: hypothetical protein PKD54_10495 [Pirellulaceae bacterium]|nr:hypothetical protein [Pirellulaceae bacterium]